MRAIWKGSVSFGLVSVPVKVYAATGTKDVRFHQVHAADGGRIRYKRVCSVDGEEVSYAEIAKGYETPDGQEVILTDADLDELPLTSSREIDVVEFVPAEQVDPVLHAKTYYLEPERTALKPYALLREALVETDRVAVVKVALRARESLAILRVREDVICLQTLLWPDEVREPAFDILGEDVALRPQELTMAASLVESLAADFDPDAFTDEYTRALTELVEAKVGSGDVVTPPAEQETGGEGAQVVDLLSALQRSVARARRSRGEGEETQEQADETDATDGTGREEPAPVRRAPARKAAEKASASEAAPARGAATEDPAEDEAEEERPARRRPAKKAASKAASRRSSGAAAGADEDDAPQETGAAATKRAATTKKTATKGTATTKKTATKGTATKKAATKKTATKKTATSATDKTAASATTKTAAKKSTSRARKSA